LTTVIYNRGAGVLPDGCLGGEAVEGGGAAAAFVGAGVSPCVEIGADDRGPGRQRDDCSQPRSGGDTI